MSKKYFILLICGAFIMLSSFTLVKFINFSFTDNVPSPSGIFYVNKVAAENFRGQSLFMNYLVVAYFPDTTYQGITLTRNAGGEVKLNNQTVSYLSNVQFYADTNFDLSSASGFNWNIAGSSRVDVFNFVNTNPIPSFNYSTLIIPSSIDTSVNFSVQLSQITNADSVFLTLSRADSVSRPPFVIKRYSTENGNFTIPKQDLKKYASGQELYFQIELSNYNGLIQSSKLYTFVNSFDYRKKIILQ